MGEPLDGFPVTRRKTRDGKVIRGQIFQTRERGVFFDPRALHAKWLRLKPIWLKPYCSKQRTFLERDCAPAQ